MVGLQLLQFNVFSFCYSSSTVFCLTVDGDTSSPIIPSKEVLAESCRLQTGLEKQALRQSRVSPNNTNKAYGSTYLFSKPTIRCCYEL